MTKKEKHTQLVTKILAEIGGKENITNVTHCITRLRFIVKDESIIDDDSMKSIDGVIGIMHSAGQYQVVVGQEVDKIFACLCEIGNFENIDELNDENKKSSNKLTIKGIGNKILESLSGSLTPLIPMLITAAMFKTLVAILGPDMLNIMSAESDLIKLFTFVGDAGFYFFPVVIGYTSAKQFKTNPILGMFLGGILLHPTLVSLAAEGGTISVFGIPAVAQNYSATIIPIILSVWVMSYLEKFFNQYVPSVLKVVFAPFLTMLIMLPIALCVLGPAGSFVGKYICEGILYLGDTGGIMSILMIGLIGALWQFLVMTGMHWLLITSLVTVFSTAGYENFISAATASASFAVGGMCLGAFIRLKKKEDKSLSLSCAFAQVIGGVTEPGLYGVGFGYKKPLIGMMIGGFTGALYGAIVGLTAYSMIPVASFLSLLSYTGGSTMNLINGIISAAIAFVVAALITYFFGFDKKEISKK